MCQTFKFLVCPHKTKTRSVVQWSIFVKKYCIIISAWPKVKLRFSPWLVLLQYCWGVAASLVILCRCIKPQALWPQWPAPDLSSPPLYFIGMSITTQMAECFWWSEESFLSFICVVRGKSSESQTDLFKILTIGAMDKTSGQAEIFAQ